MQIFVVLLFVLGGRAQCDPGQQHNDIRHRCVDCDPGFFSFGASSLCMPCPPGMYAPTAGMAKCLLCPDGTYTNTTGSVQCTPCPDGMTNTQKSTSCTFCLNGTRLDKETESPILGQCVFCGIRSVSTNNNTECLECRDDEVVAANECLPECDAPYTDTMVDENGTTVPCAFHCAEHDFYNRTIPNCTACPPQRMCVNGFQFVCPTGQYCVDGVNKECGIFTHPNDQQSVCPPSPRLFPLASFRGCAARISTEATH